MLAAAADLPAPRPDGDGRGRREADAAVAASADVDASAAARTVWPDHVRVVLDEPPRAGLADEVRERFPAAVEVVLAPRETGDGRRPTDPDRLRRTPRDLFAEYLAEHDVADDRLVPLFDELVEQVTAEPADEAGAGAAVGGGST